MHLMAANVLLEIIDPEGQHVEPGAEGEIVVTELNARYFPFIRYRLGDRGCLIEHKCGCGRTLPALRISAGRKDDYILTPEGRKIYDAILAYTLKKGIIQFKAVQERLGLLKIYVRSDAQFTAALEENYVTRLREAISLAMEIIFVRVEEIAPEKSGKQRYFRSEIKGEQN
jgi:phenylacetate-CoA ligase